MRRASLRSVQLGRNTVARLKQRANDSFIRRSLRQHTVALSQAIADKRPAIVLFAPEAGIVPHFMAHVLLAKTLQERGHRVLVIRCGSIYPRCVVMDGSSLPLDMTEPQRRSTCRSCARASGQAVHQYGIDVIELRELIDAEIRDTVARQMANLPEDLSEFTIDGVKFAQFCGAEAAVTFKVLDPFSPDPAVRTLLLRYLEGALLSFHAMRRLASVMNVARVVYFSEYAILLGAAIAARSAGIATTNITQASMMGVDRRRVIIRQELLGISNYRERLAVWNSWRNLPLPAERVSEVASDCLFRMSGNSTMVYSPVRSGSTVDLFSHLGLSPGRRLLVAFTSSLDEVSAMSFLLDSLALEPFPREQPFRDQFEWLDSLISRVEGSDDLQLVVRIHPREGANRRDKHASRHLDMLKERFSRSFEHVRFVWPADPVSSYDLAELADVGLTSWSSIALEMARMGVPVVAAFNGLTPMPVGDVVGWHATPDGYFRCIEKALAMAPALERITLAYRWWSLAYLGCAIDLGDVVPHPNFHGFPAYKQPSTAEAIEAALVGGRSVLDINREALAARKGDGAGGHEREELLKQLRRCIWFLCHAKEPASDYRLCYSPDRLQTLPAGCDAAIYPVGDRIEFRTRDGAVMRRSPMARRLAMLAALKLVENASA